MYPDANNKWNLGSAQYQWSSFHVFKDLNIYGNESTTDESHIKFNASDKTQRAIITFNGNTNNEAHSDTHLKIATSYGAIKIKPANGYLDLGSGNDLHIQANTKSYNQDIIAAYDSSNVYGIDLVIGSGATTIVGAGESAAGMYLAGIKNTENLYLSADGNVFLYTNCDTIANRRYACFDTGRNFYPDADNSGSIGTFGNRWNTGWFNTLNLAGATSSTIANSTPRIIFQEKNGANKIQAVGIVYTDIDAYRPTKGLKIMDVDGANKENVWLEVQGDIWTGGNIRINNNKSLIQNQGDTSNYTEAIQWYKGGKSQNTYNPQIGQHNTGNDGTGSICILPYATATEPWHGSVGLFIAKSRMLLDNYRVPTTGNSGGTVGSATVPVYSDGGVLKTITSYSGNAATATVASSANKLNTSAGGNTNPIYFTNGVPVRSTASVGSANQPVYLNNGVITACAGSQSGTEKQQSFRISGANGTVHWYYLGNLVSNGDDSEVIIDIYTGDGYNGNGNQNTHISIFVKDGWQSTQAAAKSFGISYLVDHSDINATAIKVKGMASAHNVIDLYVYLPWGYSNGYYSIKGCYNTWTHKGTRSTTEPTSGEVQNCVFGAFRAGQVYGAVWNDYAEYRQTKKYVQPGYCVIETGKGDLIKSSGRLQPGANIVSDTFGFAIGETEQTKTPLAVSGRVLAYPYEDRDSYQAGDPVCSGPNGTISKMTREEVREYPDRIIGTVSEIPSYENWGTGNVKVNNRIWIKVK